MSVANSAGRLGTYVSERNKMKVAVTGAGGYMGRYVVRELLSRGHEVIAVDIIPENFISVEAIENLLIKNGAK